MAISGNGQGIDVSFKAGAYLRTTTSQYCVVGMEGNTTTVVDWTAYLADNGQALNNTGTARFALGINQTYMSSSSEECTVRMLGLSKAICAGSISAGDWIIPYEGISTTSRAGHISAVLTGASVSAFGATVSAFRTVLGRAMEDGSTGTVITIFVNPQLYEHKLLAE